MDKRGPLGVCGWRANANGNGFLTRVTGCLFTNGIEPKAPGFGALCWLSASPRRLDSHVNELPATKLFSPSGHLNCPIAGYNCTLLCFFSSNPSKKKKKFFSKALAGSLPHKPPLSSVRKTFYQKKKEKRFVRLFQYLHSQDIKRIPLSDLSILIIRIRKRYYTDNARADKDQRWRADRETTPFL